MKRMNCKLIAAVFSAGVMLSSMPCLTFSQAIAKAADTEVNEEIHIWDGTSDVSWYDDEETEFHISTPEQLAGLSTLCKSGKTMEDKTFFLDCDIYWNDVSSFDDWEENRPKKAFPSIQQFYGSFLGNHHKIVGLYSLSAGLFIEIHGATITNLELEDVYIHSQGKLTSNTATTLGSIACYSDNSTIRNCTVQGKMYTSGSLWAGGGIVGAASESYFINCDNNINIAYKSASSTDDKKRARYVGGICGSLETNLSNTYIKNCANYGNLSSADNLGGICGFARANLRFCKNSGTITDSSSAGGICGTCSGILSDSYNTGFVCNYGIFASGDKYTSISNVYNTGVIGSKNNVTGTGYAIGPYTLWSASAIAITNNTYYLSGTAVKGYKDDPDTAIAKTETNMKKEAFADALGDAFYYVEGDYPKLAFEVGRTVSEFDKTSLAFKEFGETNTITLDTTYLGEPEWISSDTSVATVDSSGTVTAVGNGTAMIYALCGDSKAACSVTVGYDYYLSENELSLKKGRVHDMKLYSASTGKEAKGIDVAWSSSDESVVSVNSNGQITAKAVGTAAITAKFADMEMSCIVSVYESNLPVVVVPDDKNAPKLSETDFSISTIESKLLSVQNYSESITWVSSNTSIAKVNKYGLVKGVSEGSAVIYALLSDGGYLKANAVITKSPYQMGDVNLDSKFNVSDAVLLQKWLLAVPNTQLKSWENADFYEDGKLTATDLTLMKRELISK